MTSNGKSAQFRHQDGFTTSARRICAAAPRMMRRGPGGVMLCLLLLIAASILVMATTSCAPIPCAAGYADPNWCRYHYGVGGDGGGG